MPDYKLTYESMTPAAMLPLTEINWKEIGQVVKVGVQQGIQGQVDVDGRSYPALKSKTVLRKSKPHRINYPGQMAIPVGQDDEGKTLYVSQYPNKRLIDGGNLLFNQSIAVFANRVEISIGPTRVDAARGQIEKQGTDFFGISKNTAQSILVYISLQLDKWLKGTLSIGRT